MPEGISGIEAPFWTSWVGSTEPIPLSHVLARKEEMEETTLTRQWI